MIVRLSEPGKVAEIREHLEAARSYQCEFCAAGTRFELFLIPVRSVIGSSGVPVDRLLVAITNMHCAFHFKSCPISPT